MKECNVHIAVMSKPYHTYIYSLPTLYTALPSFTKESVLGSRVLIPFGRRKGCILGVITDVHPPALEESIPIRPLSWILDRHPFFSSQYCRMVHELALRYAIHEGAIYSSILPSPLRSLTSKIKLYNKTQDTVSLEEVAILSEEKKKEYAIIWWQNQYTFMGQDAKEFEVYTLAKDPPWDIKTNAKAQRAILHALWEEGGLTKEEIREKSGVRNYATVKQLITAGFIEVEKVDEKKEYRCRQYTQEHQSKDRVCEQPAIRREQKKNPQLPPCTEEQERVCATLQAKMGEGSSVELLFGVTGSGKSRVYCELIYHCLQHGKNAILLAPEVALVQKLVADIESFCSNIPYYVYHGYQSPLVKKELFEAVQNNTEPCILIGTRSALFLPLDNIGLCILDEEHDTSYKQDNGAFLYNAKDIAWYIAKSNNAMLLLASATPDCKTLYSAEQGRIGQHILSQRATGVQMPQLEFIDMKKEKDILSSRVIEALHEVIEKKEQAIILLNRRGYAPHMYCTSCNTVQQCPYCEVSLLYHKSMNIMRCSYCGYTHHFPQPCIQCGSMQFITLGAGTEKLQESLENLFPQEDSFIRLDRDIARNPKRIHVILEEFRNGKSPFLIGTQMLAKGHDFPRVSLSVIVDADNGLHFPDYRAMERVFQLIIQTAGRAGRGEQQGNVLIQSYSVDNPCWQFILRNDYLGLYRYEMEIREKRQYPPFMHIAMIRIICTTSYEEAKECIRNVMKVSKEASKQNQCIALGPVPSPIAVIRGQYRYQMLVKALSWQNIRIFYTGIQELLGKKKGIRIILDIDPVSMM